MYKRIVCWGSISSLYSYIKEAYMVIGLIYSNRNLNIPIMSYDSYPLFILDFRIHHFHILVIYFNS